MKTYYKLIATIVCIFQFIILNSQFIIGQNILDYRNTIFHKLTTQNGLPDNIVGKIAQDNKGFIWLATANGLVRHDGLNFKIYQNIPSDSTSLPSNLVKTFVILPDNTFYLATVVGLVKFVPESEKFEYMHTDKYPELLKYKAEFGFLFIDTKQRIWFKIGNNHIVFDTKLQKVSAIINYENYGKIGYPKEGIGNLQLFDKDGYAWFSRGDVGFFCLDLHNSILEIKKKYTRNFDSKITIPINTVALFEAKNGDLYFANNGLFVLPYPKKQTDEFEPVDLFNGKIPKNNVDFGIRSFIEDKNNTIWISRDNQGIKKYDPKTRQVEDVHYSTVNYQGVTSNTVIFDKDRNGNIWLLFSNNVFAQYQYNTKQFIEYKYDPTNPNSPAKNYFNRFGRSFIFQDKSGMYWIWSGAEGATCFDLQKAKFSLYKEFLGTKTGLSGNKAWGIYEDDTKYLWLGIQGSALNIINLLTGKVQYFNSQMEKNYEGLNNIMSISKINNEFWLGSMPLKRFTYNNISNKLTYLNDFRPSNSDTGSISSWATPFIFKDSRNNIFLGTINYGMDRYIQPDKAHPSGYFKHYRKDANNSESLADDVVNHIMEDNQNRLWISTNTGISVMNKERTKFKNFKQNKNAEGYVWEKGVKMSFQDAKGRIWIATEGDGLNQYIEKENRFIHYNKKTGFPSDNLYAVYDDNSGNLWMSSKDGIIKFDPETKESIVFGIDDGLQGTQFLFGAFHKGKSGQIYFGGNDGINHFYPDSIKLSTFVPNLVFTSLKINGTEIVANKEYNGKVLISKSLSYTDELTLSYRENIFSIEFAALDYSSPQNIRYKYQIQGVTKDWTEVSAKDNKLSFTNLAPGTYPVSIKSTNGDGVWCKNTCNLILIITPPFWQTWWFRLIIILLIIASAIAYYKYKTYAIKKKNQELERKVAERTSEVMQQKEEIQQQSEELEATNEELVAQSDALKMSNEELNQKNYEIEKSFKISQVISEFGQRVTSTFDLESINEIVYGYICSIIPTDAFGIGLYKEEKNQIEYIGFIEEGNKIDNFTKSLNSENSLTAWCINNQKVVFVNDLETEYSKFISALPSVSTNNQPHSIIHLPLSTNERKLGIIVVNSFKKNAYSNKDLIHLQLLASYITIALDNAEAYKTVNAQKEKLLELDNFKEAMTGMIVHDLKNPLNAIIGLSSMNP